MHRQTGILEVISLWLQEGIKTGILEVISLWLQEGIKPTTTLQKGLRQAITDFANWQQATRVTLGRCPQGLFTDCRAGWEIDPVA